MILAAAAHAEGKGPPPPELELAWQAEAWRALPEAGGLLDQRAGELDRMAAALNVYRAFRGWKGSTNWATWANGNKEAWRVVQTVLEMRENARTKHD